MRTAVVSLLMDFIMLLLISTELHVYGLAKGKVFSRNSDRYNISSRDPGTQLLALAIQLQTKHPQRSNPVTQAFGQLNQWPLSVKCKQSVWIRACVCVCGAQAQGSGRQSRCGSWQDGSGSESPRSAERKAGEQNDVSRIWMFVCVDVCVCVWDCR